MEAVEGANLGEGANVDSVDWEGKGSLGDDGVDGKFLLEDVWLDRERGYGFWEEIFNPNARVGDVGEFVYSAFGEASALVIKVVLV